jgi:hypothetical protein
MSNNTTLNQTCTVSGAVTTPYTKINNACYENTCQATPTFSGGGSSTPMTFSTTSGASRILDNLSMFNNGNATRITIPVAGVYILRGVIQLNNGTGNQNGMKFRKNGGTIIGFAGSNFESWHTYPTFGGANRRCMQLMCKTTLAQSDYIEMIMQPLTVATYSVVWAYFSVQRIA